MNAQLINGDKITACNEALTEVLNALFVPSTASAMVAGIDRRQLAKLMTDNLPKLGKFDCVRLEDDTQVITVYADNLTATLTAIQNAVAKNEAYRASIEVENNAYTSVRNVTSKVQNDGEKRGRKAQSIEQKFASAFG